VCYDSLMTQTPATPEWITSQLAARGMCQRACGRRAVAEVTWANGVRHGSEHLCGECWNAQAETDQRVIASW
jgi:hypothetical protein